MLNENLYCKEHGLSLRRMDNKYYVVFKDGKQFGFVARIYPSGWYFSFKGNKLPYVGTTRVEDIASFFKDNLDSHVFPYPEPAAPADQKEVE